MVKHKFQSLIKEIISELFHSPKNKKTWRNLAIANQNLHEEIVKKANNIDMSDIIEVEDISDKLD